jgi:hypothetical protein
MITTQVNRRAAQRACYDLPKKPIAGKGRGPVTISKLTPRLGVISKSSIGSSSGPESNPYRNPEFSADPESARLVTQVDTF